MLLHGPFHRLQESDCSAMVSPQAAGESLLPHLKHFLHYSSSINLVFIKLISLFFFFFPFTTRVVLCSVLNSPMGSTSLADGFSCDLRWVHWRHMCVVQGSSCSLLSEPTYFQNHAFYTKHKVPNWPENKDCLGHVG